MRGSGSSGDPDALPGDHPGDAMTAPTRHPDPGAVGPAVEHVFRHAGGELIDRPDLPLPRHGIPWRWTAVVWPDPTRADGWAALEWEPGLRGWQVPATLVLGDVVEFGTVGLDPHDQPLAGTAHRWYGWLADYTPLAAIVVGPYPDAATAERAARPLVDDLRCAQLPPLLDPLDADLAPDPDLHWRDR
jgi:hypothetical protein